MDSIFNFFFGQDLQDYWHWLNVLRPDEIKATKISLGRLFFEV